MIRNLVFLVLVFPIAGFAREASDIQLGRFEPWLKALERPLKATEDKERAAELILASPDSRVAAFNLQALARLYAGVDSRFEKMRSKSKDLEDALGEVDKWANVGDVERKAQAIHELADVLVEDRWIGVGESPRIEKFRKTLSKVPWQNAAKEKSELASVLEKQLSKIERTKYSFTHLEEGNGLHELRRELRWFLIEARVLNGLVQFKDQKSCPLPVYEELVNKPIAKSKYSNLPSDDPGVSPCRISRCLFLGLVEAVEDFGTIKDKAEKLLAKGDSDVIPEDLRAEAVARYAAMKNNNLIPEAIQEMRACR